MCVCVCVMFVELDPDDTFSGFSLGPPRHTPLTPGQSIRHVTGFTTIMEVPRDSVTGEPVFDYAAFRRRAAELLGVTDESLRLEMNEGGHRLRGDGAARGYRKGIQLFQCHHPQHE